MRDGVYTNDEFRVLADLFESLVLPGSRLDTNEQIRRWLKAMAPDGS